MRASTDYQILEHPFFHILKERQIRTVFQPIISLRNGTVYGYEALSRGPQDSPLHEPELLFDCAEEYGKMWELELLCRSTAIEAVSQLEEPIKLFLNVNPQIMYDEKFRVGFTKEFLNSYHIDPHNIIIEITEKGSVNNVPDFIRIVEHYKKQGYKIAIDDAGAGYSGLNLISDIHPHFLKLDMKLIHGIEKDTMKQALVKSLSEFASLTNISLIAEGIETKAELNKLIDIGVQYGQGFYLQKPDSSILPIRDSVKFDIKEANARKNQLLDRRITDLFICNISTTQKCLTPKIMISQVYDLMEKDKTITGFCITENEYLIGIITRSRLYNFLSGQYGYNLYARKTIDLIMSTEFLQVDYHESVHVVSKLAMARNTEHLYDFISITHDSRYYGIVTVKDLLEKTIQVEVNNARHLNPLSELPGNILIEKRLEACLMEEDEYNILYFDMNNFKAYNDVYGFENGDRCIKNFARIMRNRIHKEKDFIGHIGGDDFMAIVQKCNIEKLCRNIISDFSSALPKFYNQNDLNRGFITTKNRHGVEEDFPLLSIAIACVSSKTYQTVYQLSEDITHLKKACKQKGGSAYLMG